MEFKTKEKTIMKNMRKNTIIVGENGSGKTTIINLLKKVKKLKINLKEYNIEVFFAGIENVKEDIDSTKADYKKEISKFNDKLKNISFNNQDKIKKELDLALEQAKEELSDSMEKEIISPKIKLSYSLSLNEIIQSKHTFNFNGKKYDLKEMPSGVRKLIHIYFKTINIENNKNEKKLILLDEIDSMLRPSWVKLVTGLVKKWMKDPDIYVVLSTHKPETLYRLNEYCESISKVNISLDGVEYIQIESMLETFNDINDSFIKKFEKCDKSKFVQKLKVKFSFQISHIFFSQKSPIILTEGITDEMFFKNKTNKIVISTFGFWQLGLYLSILKWIKGDFENVFLILDGDGELSNKKSKQYLLKQKIDKLSIHNFYYENNLEEDQFGCKGKVKREDKFKILEENYENTSFDENLKKILND